MASAKHGFVAAVLAALLGASAPAIAIIPVSGTLAVTAEVFRLDLPETLSITRDGHWQSVPASLSHDFQIGTTGQAPFAKGVAAASNSKARWRADGLSGSVEFDWAWVLQSDPGTGLIGASFVAPAPNWSYSFVADRSGVLIWEGQIRPGRGVPVPYTFNNLFGLSGWNLTLNGVTVIDLMAPDGGGVRQGDASFALVAGETYSFALTSFSNIAGENFPVPYYGNVIGEFNYLIVEDAVTPVPEPGSWALMILGFGLVGARLRTQSPRRAAA